MKISDLPPGSAVLVPAEWLAERVGEETPNGGEERQATIRMWVERCFASLVEDRRAASKQAGTRQETLERIYEQDDPEPKIRAAKEVARRRERRDD